MLVGGCRELLGASSPRGFATANMLTEARVILPGAQAVLGFQLLVTLSNAFEALPRSAQLVHFATLAMVSLAVVLLIAPVAIHRIAFEGADDHRSLRLGSHIVTGALVPFACGIAAQMYVAAVRLFDSALSGQLAAALTLLTLLALWYALPWTLRTRPRARYRSSAKA